jgi:hypothetical protein
MDTPIGLLLGDVVTDASGLALIAQSALPAAFTFLFQQVDALLTRRRGHGDGEQEAAAVEVPAGLVGELSLPLTVDEGQLTARLGELKVSKLALARYREDPSLVSSGDTTLMEMLSSVREALEAIHGQHFTFPGEQRPGSGPFVGGTYQEIEGRLTGMQADTIRGHAVVKLDVGVIRADAEVIGMRAKSIEGPS